MHNLRALCSRSGSELCFSGSIVRLVGLELWDFWLVFMIFLTIFPCWGIHGTQGSLTEHSLHTPSPCAGRIIPVEWIPWSSSSSLCSGLTATNVLVELEFLLEVAVFILSYFHSLLTHCLAQPAAQSSSCMGHSFFSVFGHQTLRSSWALAMGFSVFRVAVPSLKGLVKHILEAGK